MAAIVTGQGSIGVVLAALFVLSTAEVFADTRAHTVLPMLVARDDLAIANSRLLTLTITFNQLAGPPLGAALFVVGSAWPFGAGVLTIFTFNITFGAAWSVLVLYASQRLGLAHPMLWAGSRQLHRCGAACAIQIRTHREPPAGECRCCDGRSGAAGWLCFDRSVIRQQCIPTHQQQLGRDSDHDCYDFGADRMRAVGSGAGI